MTSTSDNPVTDPRIAVSLVEEDKSSVTSQDQLLKMADDSKGSVTDRK